MPAIITQLKDIFQSGLQIFFQNATNVENSLLQSVK